MYMLVSEFKGGKKHGQGTLTYAEGRVEKGTFNDDEFTSTTTSCQNCHDDTSSVDSVSSLDDMFSVDKFFFLVNLVDNYSMWTVLSSKTS